MLNKLFNNKPSTQKDTNSHILESEHQDSLIACIYSASCYLGIYTSLEEIKLNLSIHKSHFSLSNLGGFHLVFLSKLEINSLLDETQVVFIFDKSDGYGVVQKTDKNDGQCVVVFANGKSHKFSFKKLIGQSAYTLRKIQLSIETQFKEQDDKKSLFSLLKGGLNNIIVASVFMHILALVVPFYTSIYFNTIVPNEAWATMAALSFGAFLAIFFTAILKEVRSEIGQWYSQKIEQISAKKALAYMKKNHRYLFGVEGLGRTWMDLPATLQKSMSLTSANYVLPLIDLIASIFYFVVIYIIASYLVLVPLLVGLFILYLAKILSNHIIIEEDKLIEVAKSKNTGIVEYIKGIEQIQLLPKLPIVFDKLQQSLLGFSQQNSTMAVLSARFQTIVQTLSQAQTILLLFVGLVGMVNEDLSVGGVFATLLLVGRLSTNIGGAFNLLLLRHKRQKAQEVMTQINQQVIQNKPSHFRKISLKNYHGKIKIENLSHQYPLVNAINGINCVIESGEILAISGDSGSGKTTLLHLIAGLLTTKTGNIFYNDVKQTQLSFDELTQQVSLSLQQPIIFSGTIASNFYWEKDEHNLYKELKKLGIIDFVLNSSSGLNTHLEPDGLNLSGGQRQAISVARAIIRSDNPKVLLLDEPLSGLDDTQQLQLLQYLTKHCKGKTIIFASNDRPILTMVGRVIKLKNGSIVLDNKQKIHYNKITNE